MSQPYTLKWGISATGDNARKFAKDILLPPSLRDVQDVQHQIVAVSSRTIQSARQFLSYINTPSASATYTTYTDLANDPDVDIVYIASPHSHHFEHALLFLRAGKHVLLEKAFTVNASQAKILVDLAKEKELFLMEALWTRFFPLVDQVKRLVGEGEIGVVQRVVADRSLGRDIEALYGTEHRLVKKELAGGALLDLGIYPLTWVFLILYHLQAEEKQEAPMVTSSMIMYAPTAVDESVSMIVSFPKAGTQGVVTASIRVAASDKSPGVRILGSKGEIQIFGPAARPDFFQVVKPGERISVSRFEISGHGLFWEADECARCIRDGKAQSEIMPLKETLLIMELMDEVRHQNDLMYPDTLETLCR